MNKLLEVYSAILIALDYQIDDKGYLYYGEISEEAKTHIRIAGKSKPLVLPTQSALNNLDWTTVVGFHPGSESTYCGQSEIINFLTKSVAIKICNTVQYIVAAIVDLGMKLDIHGKLNLKQKELLNKFNIDRNVEQVIIKILKNSTGISGKHPLLSARLARGGEINGETYARVAMLVLHVLNNEDSICGVNPGSAKVKESVLTLYKEILPKEFTVGSNSAEAPYLMAILKLFFTAATELNRYIAILGKYSPINPMPVDWYDETKAIPKLTKEFLPQQLIGNVGKTINRHKPEESDEVDESAVSKLVAPVKPAGFVKRPDEPIYQSPVVNQAVPIYQAQPQIAPPVQPEVGMLQRWRQQQQYGGMQIQPQYAQPGYPNQGYQQQPIYQQQQPLVIIPPPYQPQPQYNQVPQYQRPYNPVQPQPSTPLFGTAFKQIR